MPCGIKLINERNGLIGSPVYRDVVVFNKEKLSFVSLVPVGKDGLKNMSLSSKKTFILLSYSDGNFIILAKAPNNPRYSVAHRSQFARVNCYVASFIWVE